MNVVLDRSPDTVRRWTMVSLFHRGRVVNIGFTGASTAATLVAAGLGGEAVSGLPSARRRARVRRSARSASAPLTAGTAGASRC
jgi:hypothetical protein